MPTASRTKELAPSAPITQRAVTVRVSSVGSRPCAPSSWRRRVIVAPPSPCSRPSATQPRCDGDAGGGARSVERLLELRLEEQVVGLPSRLATASPASSVISSSPSAPYQWYSRSGSSSSASLSVTPDGLQQAHDLVVDVDGARQAVDLAEPLERLDAVAGPAEHARDRLAHGPESDDRDVELVVHS